MKNFFAVAFILSALELIGLIIKLRPSDHKFANSMRWALLAGVGATLATLLTVTGDSAQISMIGYSLFFVCIVWVAYYVLILAMEFTGHRIKKPLLLRGIRILQGLDNISMLLNIKFAHAFQCEPVFTQRNEIFFRIVPSWGLYMHMILTYSLLGGTFVFLAVKSVKTSALYRRRYYVVFAVVVALVLADVIWMFTGQVVNVSVAAFGIGAIIFYFLFIVYTPRALLSATLSHVAQQMTEALLLYDVEGNSVYVNESARKLFGIGAKEEEKAEQLMCRWREKAGALWKYYALEEEYVRDGQEYRLKVEYRRIEDEKGRSLGSVFSVQDQTEQIKRIEREHYKATHDKLTELYNKEYFYERAEQYIKEHPEEKLLMVCSNVRNFKMVNDIFGIQVGDELLVKMGNALHERMAAEGIYGRLESDRFALLMPKYRFREETFVEGLKEIVKIDSDMSYPVNVYVGVYEITDTSIPVSVMCDRAFMAVNTIKGNYISQVAYYDDQLRSRVLQEQQLMSELEPAIQSGQFRIYLQPQIMASGEVDGAEALVRWEHPEKGLLMPGAFIEALERNGTIFKLDQHIWELACRQLKRWRDMGHRDMYLSVNISSRDFYFLDIYRVFTEMVRKYGIEPRNLKLEITETAMMMDLERQLELIERLRDVGFVVEMDDFGSGYSSLNMLKDIRVDIIKVDMKFLEKTDDEERSRKILKHVIELSRDLGMPVITEGVETEEQVKYLKEIGCDMFQGYYFAKPMQVMEFEQRYMNRDI